MRTPAMLLCVALLLGGVAAAQEGEQAARPRRAQSGATPHSLRDDASFLKQLADAQRGLGEQIQQLKEAVDAIRAEQATRHDEQLATDQEVKALRDEVKGLYVESSNTKQMIDALKDDVAAVNSNVSGFRTFSGFFLAAMILMLFLVLVLSIRR